mmetsp:Transcript_18076/g.28353  ORF Transcript_18076/g.28353 Transcript_18076/m.28353 type:complete len:341 (-) Transcript_18076:578-1600(-)|eukprot:CAMPEP_0201731270 /NCGR_PEP_ID=MMETSP0593-20130828/25198_1 /ASSEMBLY_ACC=CAM_ASM_000672 /TAXON_ID=267983 /ORGANISM="Skeletonema japonicum, Strain CCMP2506" /LENGTH=340 /DNA_ID=CAMNT_0048224011 /DNA_START=155 /DNA_END=1177 /DNA_ORIENTATION=-
MTVKDYGSSAQQPANVQVIAPATLNAGYTFDASYEGNTFTVTVPEGGVVKGQRFIVPYIPPAVAAEGTPIITGAPLLPLYSPNMRGTGEYRIPTGAWRDSLCDCFKFGPCHPSLLTACCCRPILVAQLLTRMKMTWLGQRTHVRTSTSANLSDSRTEVDQRWKSTFRNILLVLVLCIVLLTVVFPAPPMEDPTDPDAYDNLSVEEQRNLTINKLLSALFAFYFFYLLVQLRATLRHVYSIPEQSCLCLYCGSNPSDGIFCSGDGRNRLCSAGVPVGWEDVCCAMCCPLCITSQMARHTVDYDYRRATCCNSVGVSTYMDDEAYEGIENGGVVGDGSVLVV